MNWYRNTKVAFLGENSNAIRSSRLQEILERNLTTLTRFVEVDQETLNDILQRASGMDAESVKNLFIETVDSLRNKSIETEKLIEDFKAEIAGVYGN